MTAHVPVSFHKLFLNELEGISWDYIYIYIYLQGVFCGIRRLKFGYLQQYERGILSTGTLPGSSTGVFGTGLYTLPNHAHDDGYTFRYGSVCKSKSPSSGYTLLCRKQPCMFTPSRPTSVRQTKKNIFGRFLSTCFFLRATLNGDNASQYSDNSTKTQTRWVWARKRLFVLQDTE